MKASLSLQKCVFFPTGEFAAGCLPTFHRANTGDPEGGGEGLTQKKEN